MIAPNYTPDQLIGGPKGENKEYKILFERAIGRLRAREVLQDFPNLPHEDANPMRRQAARPGDIITDGTDEYLILSTPELCTSCTYPNQVFKTPALGCFVTIGRHGTRWNSSTFARLLMNIRQELPTVLEQLGVDNIRHRYALENWIRDKFKTFLPQP